MGDPESDPKAYPTTLRIRFAAGERPYIFWLSRWVRHEGENARFKMISKRLENGGIEFLVVRENEKRRRRSVAHLTLPRNFPSGWLERWVDSFEAELGTRFHCYDLRTITTQEEWREIAMRLGWSLE